MNCQGQNGPSGGADETWLSWENKQDVSSVQLQHKNSETLVILVLLHSGQLKAPLSEVLQVSQTFISVQVTLE